MLTIRSLLAHGYQDEVANNTMVRHGSMELECAISLARGHIPPTELRLAIQRQIAAFNRPERETKRRVPAVKKAPPPKKQRKPPPPPPPPPPPRVPKSRAEPPGPTPQSVTSLIAAVGREFDLTVADLHSPRRSQNHLLARAIVSRILRDQKRQDGKHRYSLPQIGRYLCRDHSTICNALDKFESFMNQYPEAVEVHERLAKQDFRLPKLPARLANL